MKKILILWCLFIKISIKAESLREQLSPAQSILVGSTVGVGEVLFPGHILFSIMNQRIDKPKAKLNLNPRLLYKGVRINALLKAPVISAQMLVGSELRKYLTQNGKSKLSNTQLMGTAFVSGVASSVIATPQEAIPVYMQKYNKETLETIFKVRLRVWRGFIALAIRDGSHALGYQALAPILQKLAKEKIENKTTANILGSASAGVIVSSISQPFAVIKTKMQGDPDQNIYKSFLKTIRTIYKEEGIRGFFRGFIWRSARITASVPIYVYFTKKFTEMLNSEYESY